MERLGMESAPSVPKTGTVGAFRYGKCAFRPKNRDGGSVWEWKVRLLSQKQGRWERLGMESAPSVPKTGALGTLWECWGRFKWMLGALLGCWERLGWMSGVFLECWERLGWMSGVILKWSEHSGSCGRLKTVHIPGIL